MIAAPTLSLDPHAVALNRLPLEQASQLPGAAFTDPAVLAWETRAIFQSGWICVGHHDQVREKGQFIMRDVGEENVLVVAGADGVPRAFHNSCRHRGARLVDEPEGQVKALTCPYHAWTYGFDGSLRSANFTDELEGFDKGCYGLRAIRTALVEGLVLIDLEGSAPPAEEVVGELAPLMARYKTGGLRRAARVVYEVEANWKVIAENYSECLHCPGVHPELNRLSHYLSGETIEGEGLWCGGSMTLSEGADTMARHGGATVRPPIEGLTEADCRSILYFLLFPNSLVSLHPDYLMLHTLWPKAPGLTEVTCEWFFEPSTIAAEGFDPSDAVEFWDQVNREDWEVCRLTQRGMGSRGFIPGRYTTQEGDVHAFDLMVADRYADALETAGVPA